MTRLAALAVTLLAAGCIAAAAPAPTPATAAPTTTTAAPLTTTTAPATTTVPPAPTTAVPATTTVIPSTTTTTTTVAPLLGVTLEIVIADAGRPLFVGAPPGDDRLFVLERNGLVLLVDAGEVSTFLDLTDRVGAIGIEQGLLGLAFHPDYAANGRLFVYYTDATDASHLAEFSVSPDPGRGDADSERTLLLLEQPTNRHNAGMIEFGPDGYLYVALGDGGTGGEHGQRTDSLYGTILRLDVDGEEPYAVPPDNPFVAGGGLPEIWAYGLRNPWRFSIDSVAGLIYVADVGQSDWEEINVVPLTAGGANFGWPAMEGVECFLEPGCDPAAYTLPVDVYGHDEGCSITGGYVYRGDAIPELLGHYVYADWCRGWVRSFRFDGETVTERRDWTVEWGIEGQVDSFGVDGSGELYVATWEGLVARVVPVR